MKRLMQRLARLIGPGPDRPTADELFRKFGMGIWEADEQMRFTYVSPHIERMLSFETGVLLGTRPQDHMSAEEAERTTRLLEEAVDTGAEVIQLETLVSAANGENRFCEVSISPIRRGARILGYIGNCRDISRRKRTEVALAHREEELQTIYDISPIGIAVVDRSTGRFVDANPRLLGILGYTLDELRSRTVSDVTHPDDVEREQEALDLRFSGETERFRIEKRYIRKDGDIRWVRVSGDVMPGKHRDGTPHGEGERAVAYVEDVTEQRAREGDLAQLAAVVEQAAESVVLTDTDGNIKYVNPYFKEMTGYSREEVIGRNPRLLKSGIQDDEFYIKLWDTISVGKVWRGQMVNKAKDGSLFTESATISAVRDATGSIVGYAGVKRDLTREVTLESQLRRSQRMEALGQLAGGIAHDFNNLILVINGYVSIVLESLPADSSARSELDEVAKAGSRAEELVNQLLVFSRNREMQLESVDVNDVVSRVVRMLSRIIGEQIRLTVIEAAHPGWVFGDASMLEQVLMNLCLNARDAMPEGGELSIETEQVVVGPDYCMTHIESRPGRYMLISISDTGCGMDDETKTHIFEPFFTTKPEGKGTGLGMATVYGIVKKHEGIIQVYSELDRGTTVKVYLPISERNASEVGPKIEERVRTGEETILLAEDDPDVRVFVRDALATAGYHVLEAVDGRAAVDLSLEHSQIDLLLLDVVMPRLSGPEACREIRSVRTGIPVMFTSGYAENHVQTNAVLESGSRLLRKPFSRQDLLRMVRQVLDESGHDGPEDDT